MLRLSLFDRRAVEVTRMYDGEPGRAVISAQLNIKGKEKTKNEETEKSPV